MGLLAFVVACAFFTSVLSGVLGMAGGMVLMALLPLKLGLGAAMITHGILQFTSNGARAWLLWRHVDFGLLRHTTTGAVAAFLVLLAVRFVPDKALVYLGLGLLPFVRHLPFPAAWLSLHRPWVARACGALVSAVQILAGVAGPLLDVFFLSSKLDRFGVVATKAANQAVAHLLKIAFYLLVFLWEPASIAPGSDASEAPFLFGVVVPFAVVAAVGGTRLGASLLDRLSEKAFRNATARVVEAVGVVCLWRAAELM